MPFLEQQQLFDGTETTAPNPQPTIEYLFAVGDSSAVSTPTSVARNTLPVLFTPNGAVDDVALARADNTKTTDYLDVTTENTNTRANSLPPVDVVQVINDLNGNSGIGSTQASHQELISRSSYQKGEQSHSSRVNASNSAAPASSDDVRDSVLSLATQAEVAAVDAAFAEDSFVDGIRYFADVVEGRNPRRSP